MVTFHHNSNVAQLWGLWWFCCWTSPPSALECNKIFGLHLGRHQYNQNIFRANPKGSEGHGHFYFCDVVHWKSLNYFLQFLCSALCDLLSACVITVEVRLPECSRLLITVCVDVELVGTLYQTMTLMKFFIIRILRTWFVLT